MKNMRWILLAAATAAATPGFGQAVQKCEIIELPGVTNLDTVSTIDADNRLLRSVGLFGWNIDLTGRSVEKTDDGIRIREVWYSRDPRSGPRDMCRFPLYEDRNTNILEISDKQLADWGYVYMIIATQKKEAVDALVPLEELKNSSERVVEKAITGRVYILRTLVRKVRAAASGRKAGEAAKALAESLPRS